MQHQVSCRQLRAPLLLAEVVLLMPLHLHLLALLLLQPVQTVPLLRVMVPQMTKQHRAVATRRQML